MTIVLLRHGKTQGNLEHRYIGSTDEPLCEEGRRELLTVRPLETDMLYVSPLRRCRETAEILFPHVEQHVSFELRECSFGTFENHTYEELKNDPAYRNWLDGKGDPPEGESKEHQQSRSVAAFLQITERHKTAERLTFVVHGGTIMCLLEALEESHVFYDWQVDNGGGFLCTWDARFLHVEKRL